MAKKITEDGEIIDEVTQRTVAFVPGPFFKTPWNHDTDAESLATGLGRFEETKTQQQFAAEADINNILRKFMTTGELPVVGQAKYQDNEEFDLQSAMVTRHQVQEAWDALPAEARNALRDPLTFADYVEHCLETGDLEPLRNLGLATKPTEEPTAPKTPEGGTPAPAGEKAAPAA